MPTRQPVTTIPERPISPVTTDPRPPSEVPRTIPVPEPDPTHSPVLPRPAPPRKGEEATYEDLYEEARRRRLRGRSAMSKTELARALGW